MKRVAILAATLVAAAAPACAQAAFPGRDGRIAYTSDWFPDDCGMHSCEEEYLGLNTIRSDGTGQRPIGRCGRRAVACEEHQPAWSPDGRRIALVHDDSIWVMRADGSRAHRVFAGSSDSPSWSPDGRHIVFTELYAYTGWITIMRPDGSHRRRLTRSRGNSDPSWSVDGLIAYSNYHGVALTQPPSIDTVRLDGRRVGRIKGKGRVGFANPDFSPDGKLIAFERYDNDDGISIWTSRPDGSRRRRVVADGLAPAWSPRGRFIAYSGPVQAFPRSREIFVARRDGSDPHQVGPSPRRKGDRLGDYGEPSWQPLPNAVGSQSTEARQYP